MNASTRLAVTALVAALLLAAGVENASAQRTVDEILTGGDSARSAWKQRVLTNRQPRTPRLASNSRSTASARQNISFAAETLAETETEQLEPIAIGEMHPMAGDAHAMGDCGNCDQCGGCDPCGPDCGPDCGCGACICFNTGWLHRFSFFAGVQGFKGPADFGANGNFGIHAGLNFGAPLGGPTQIGYQIGFQTVNSDFSGSWWDTDSRDQVFFTAGLFRRALCGGFQWGVAFDLMHDNYYYGKIDLKQMRVEAAFVRPGCREIGFFGAFGTGDDTAIVDHDTLLVEPTSMYALYYRRYFCEGGQGRVWGSFTDEGDGLLGADMRLPLGRKWALETNVNYLIPKQGRHDTGFAEESWGMAMRLVWYPGRSSHCIDQDPFHPLFNVADNSTFMTDVSWP